jgi:hypothetical protein
MKKTITCHDCHGFKWQNIYICQILTICLCGPMPFLARWNVTAPKKRILKPKAHYAKNISWNQLDFKIFETIEL